MRFRARIELIGKSATTIIEVPEDILTSLGAGNRPRISATIHGYTYRTSVGARDGIFLFPVSAEARQRAGVALGDEVDVAVALDTEPREGR